MLLTWESEFVVHHAMSNDTHRLAEPAGRILTELLAASSGGVVDPGNGLELPADEVQATLAVLAELGFITQC